MTTKKIILITSILIIVFLFIGWIISRPIIEMLIDYYVSLTKNSQIVATSMSEQFQIHFYSIVSIGLLPFFSSLVVILLTRTKNLVIPLKGYFLYLIYIITGFVIGGLIKIFLLARVVKTMDNQDFPQMINTFPLKHVKFHDWGLIVSLITCILIYFMTKKVKFEN